jgi:phage shock protein C
LAEDKNSERRESTVDTKRLYRGSDVMLGGVASGLAEYFNLDPTIVRLLFVLIGFVSGGFPGVVVYLILWAIMPKKPTA